MPGAPQTQLRDNIRLLGNLLGETFQTQMGEELFNKVEAIRGLAIGNHGSRDLSELVSLMNNLSDDELIPVARAFAQFLNYANIAEQQNLVRVSQASQRANKTKLLSGTIDELLPRLSEKGISDDTLFDTISQLQIELVLTAHPTEITRRTLRRKYNDITNILAQFDRGFATSHEQQSQTNRLKRRVLATWQTDEIRRKKPTPIDEAKWGYATVEETLWQALPDFLRKLDKRVEQQTGKRLPLHATPIRFTSWMGGDRDGNPNVTSKVTEEVVMLGRWQAAQLLLTDIQSLRENLSFSQCSQEIRSLVGDHPEPYRELLRGVKQRLKNTRAWAEESVMTQVFHGQIQPDQPIYFQDHELLEVLQLIYDSLVEGGLQQIADGSLTTIIRRVACFGLTLLKLDIRQDSARHKDTINEITEYLSIRVNGQPYKDWSEDDKQTFLLSEIQSLRPLIPAKFPASDDVQEVLNTFGVLAKQPPSALGAYIISMATHPSDVLAVRLLQKEAGCEFPQRIVPLFETLNDLEGAANTIDRLLSIDDYKASIKGKQEVMIGYSDSAKDAGFLAASWGQYSAQEALSQVCENHRVHLTLFHGRGGSASRGGGPAHDALLSQPPGTIKGSVRVTEQGEMIQFKFGIHDLAINNLELYTSGALEATLAPSSAPDLKWREMMQQLSDISVKEYRRIVHKDPRFVPYFRQVTPELELRRLALGSRPAKRHVSGGVESLRAIPWVFAWTQMRFMLPAWLGTGKALAEALQTDKATLKDMRENWTFFKMLMDMQEMVLAKVNPRVTSYYELRLIDNNKDQAALADLGKELHDSLDQAFEAMETLMGHKLLENNPVLRQTILRRNPYIDPLHITQVELMRRLRETSEGENPLLEQGLMVSIAGIAAGLRNTG